MYPYWEGGGTCCANCGKLISRIATVKSDKGTFEVGFDCLETLLQNNMILEGYEPSEHGNDKKDDS